MPEYTRSQSIDDAIRGALLVHNNDALAALRVAIREIQEHDAQLNSLTEQNAAMREIVQAVAEMNVECDVFDQPLYALMQSEHQNDEQWYQDLITKARAIFTESEAPE